MQEITKNKDLQKNLATEARDMMIERLRDIDGLDGVSWWPLAPGVWILIILVLLIIIGNIIFYLKKRAWKLSWKGQIFEELDMMQKTINAENASDFAVKLSEILRRIAMHKYGRADCAALMGERWLTWLQKRDVEGFNWLENGTLLTEEIFAPNSKNLDQDKVIKLIVATKNWVK